MKKQEKILNILLPILSIACIFILWAISAKLIGSEFILPSVKSTINEFFILFSKADFYHSYFSTLLRAFIAFICSFVLAMLIAIFSKKNKHADKFFSPLIIITRALPTIAIVLLLLIWTNRFVAPVIVTMLVVFPTLYTNIKSALFSIDEEAIEMCRLYKVKEKQIFFKVQLPQISPYLFLACGSGLSLNLKLMVAAEVLAATSDSLGKMLSNADNNLMIAQMLAIVLATVITGIIIESVFKFISKKMVKWK